MSTHATAERKRRRVRFLLMRRWFKDRQPDAETVIAALRERCGTDKEEGR
jgi:hypothetical protein